MKRGTAANPLTSVHESVDMLHLRTLGIGMHMMPVITHSMLTTGPDHVATCKDAAAKYLWLV